MHKTRTPKASWLITVHGVTNGSDKTGSLSLANDFFNSAVTYIRIPQGLKARIWSVEMTAGTNATTFALQTCPDATSPSWTTVRSWYLAANSYVEAEKMKRPIVVGPSRDGKLGIQFTWSQGSQDALAHLNATIEIYEP